MYVKAQEFLHLMQRNMSVREFSTKLNLLAKYVPCVANLERDKLEVFMGRLRPNIAKDVIVRDNPLKTF